jgi:WD40 repeat protein
LAFHPAQQHLLAATHRNGISIWDLEQERVVQELTNHTDQVVAVTFSKTGDRMFSGGSDQTIRVWDTRNWQEVRAFRGHEDEVYCIGLSEGGDRMVSGGGDNLVCIWSTALPDETQGRFTLDSSQFKGGLAVGTEVFLPSARGLEILDLQSLAVVDRIVIPGTERRSSVVASSDGKRIATLTDRNEIAIWRTQPVAKLETLRWSGEEPATWCAFSPVGRLVLAGHEGDTIQVWDLAGGVSNKIEVSLCAVDGYWLSPDENELRFLEVEFPGPKYTVGIFDLDSGLQSNVSVPWGHKYPWANASGLSSDQQFLATASAEGKLVVTDLRSNKILRIYGGQMIMYESMAFAHDQTRLAAGGWDGTITLFDMVSHRQVARWKAHIGPVWELRFSQDDRVLISCGQKEDRGRAGPAELRSWIAPCTE